MPAGQAYVVVQNIRAVPAENHVAEAKARLDSGEELFERNVFAPQHAVDIEAAELDLFDLVFRKRLLDLLGIHACHVAAAPSSPWRNPFFLSDGSDNGDSGSFEMDEAAEAKNKGLCYRCTSGSA